MASNTGSYIETEITKLPEMLVSTLMYGQCMASNTGSSIDLGITKSPVGLNGTSM